jgi:hypothetical protein
MGRREKDGVRCLQAYRVGIVAEALGERWREWDQAVFAELALVDRQDTHLQIHITAPEPQRFAHAQSTAVQHAEEFGEDEMPQGCMACRSQPISHVEETAHLGVAQDRGREA